MFRGAGDELPRPTYKLLMGQWCVCFIETRQQTRLHSGRFLVSRMRDGEKTRIADKATNFVTSDLKDCGRVKTARTWAWQLLPSKQCVTTDLPNTTASKIQVAYTEADAAMLDFILV